jgi:hypothetical protein
MRNRFHLKDPQKLKIIYYLFAVVILLLFFNLGFNIFLNDKSSSSNKKEEINRSELDEKFKISLFNLGFENTWIKPLKNSEAKLNRDAISYSISVPGDLPIPVVLDEINNIFYDCNVTIKSEEQKINGRTILKISAGDNRTKINDKINNGGFSLTAEFNYDKSLSRNAGKIGIFITGITKLSGEDLNDFLQIPENFELLLVPSKSSSEILETVKASNRGYGILLNDDINDLDFKLSESYSKPRLKSSIRDIIGNFQTASVYVIDDRSNLFASNVYPLLKEEFNKRSLHLIIEDSLSNLTNESKDAALQIFQRNVGKTKWGEKEEFVVSSEEFLNLQPEIIKYRKIGYKFVRPSELIKDQ